MKKIIAPEGIVLPKGITLVDPQGLTRGMSFRKGQVYMATRLDEPQKCPIWGIMPNGNLAIMNSYPPNELEAGVAEFPIDEIAQLAVAVEVMMHQIRMR